MHVSMCGRVLYHVTIGVFHAEIENKEKHKGVFLYEEDAVCSVAPWWRPKWHPIPYLLHYF